MQMDSPQDRVGNADREPQMAHVQTSVRTSHPNRIASFGLTKRLSFAIVTFVALGLPFSELFGPRIYVTWFAGVALLCVLGLASRSGVPVGGSRWWVVAAYCCLLGTVAAIQTAANIPVHLAYGIQIIVFVGVLPYASKWLIRSDPRIAVTAVVSFLLGQSVSSSYAVAEALGIGGIGGTLLFGRAEGLSGHPNILGFFSGVSVVVAAYIVVHRDRGRLLPAGVLLINALGLLVSGSVSALLATGVGVLVLILGMRIRLRVVLPMLAFGIAAFTGISVLSSSGVLRGPMQRLLQVTGQTGEQSSWDIRQNTYSFAWEGIRLHPVIGRGLDDVSGATFDQITVTHNVLLRAWYQGGFGMMLGFAIVFFILFGGVVSCVIRVQDLGAAAVLAVVLAFSLTSAALQQPYFWLTIMGAWAFIDGTPGRYVRGIDMSSVAEHR